jgi:hypothetical protein
VLLADLARPVSPAEYAQVLVQEAVWRGPEALARLPEAERQEWQKLWADVADTLARAAEMFPR